MFLDSESLFCRTLPDNPRQMGKVSRYRVNYLCLLRQHIRSIIAALTPRLRIIFKYTLRECSVPENSKDVINVLSDQTQLPSLFPLEMTLVLWVLMQK